jgi:nitroimidazol reductase NimA-like FMN-containing flavoprotein (pyridoxamine 5'-phosphate oxidase superfamily)
MGECDDAVVEAVHRKSQPFNGVNAMRRKDKEVKTREEIDAIIAGCQVFHLAMAANNVPYVVPLCFGYDRECLYFHTAGSGRKIDWLTINPRVCFQMERGVRLVDGGTDPCKWSFQFESVIGSGHVEELTEEEDRIEALRRIVRQYTDKAGDHMRSSADLKVWRLVIEDICAKKSPA